MHSLPPPRRTRVARARAIAFLLLVMQGFIALSPLGEPRAGGVALQIHVEAQGTTHPDTHRDDTCALCAARSAFAALQVPVTLLTGIDRLATVPCARDVTSPSTAGLCAHLSRAPPALIN